MFQFYFFLPTHPNTHIPTREHWLIFSLLVYYFYIFSPGQPFRVLTGPNYWVFKCSVSPDSSLIASVCNLDTVSKCIDFVLYAGQDEVWVLAIGGSCENMYRHACRKVLILHQTYVISGTVL